MAIRSPWCRFSSARNPSDTVPLVRIQPKGSRPDSHAERVLGPLEANRADRSLQSIRNISDNLECKKQERENNSVNEKIRELKHLIEHAEHEIRQAKDEESRRIERISMMEENLSNSLITIRDKFDRCSKDKARLLIPGEME